MHETSSPPLTLTIITGLSGAGKSTVFQLLLRFFAAQQGSVLFDGINIADLDPIDLRRHIAVVAQDPVIFSGSLAANIAYGREGAGMEEVRRAARIFRDNLVINHLRGKTRGC